DRDSDWFGLPEGSDWVLNNPYTDKPFLQNFLAYELFEKMGHYSVRRRFVEVFVNTAGGKVTYPRDYVGVYILLEKIKVDKHRVPIEKLTPYDNTEPDISGGYMFKKDKPSTGDVDFYTNGGPGAGFSGQDLKIHEPNPREITSQQLSWLNDYINQFEDALYADDWLTRTGTNHYSAFIDVDSFVDQHWIVEFAKQIDGYRLSNYLSKDRNGKIKMEPIWDYNLSFGNADYNDGFNTSGWYWKVLGESDHLWLRRLICGTPDVNGTTGDPDFNQRIADRWSELRTNVFNSTNVLARVDQLAALLNEAAARDFQKWQRLGTYVWPNPSFYVTPTTYSGIISAMKTWIRGRYNWIDTQFIVPPRLGLPEGRIPAGISATIISNAPGTIYYTLDGTDPRLPGGALSRNATSYTGPIPLTKNSRLFARTLNGVRWSGPAAATYVMQTPTLTISEIMYHPAPATGANALDEEEYEYLEFKNTGSAAINLGGFSITDGVTFTFPSYNLAAGARVLVVKNKIAFESRYGTGLPIAGEFVGQLDNSGEHITVIGKLKEPILDFTYNDAWLKITDGAGFALVLNDETVSPDKLNLQSSWRAGSVFNGTPGQPESASSEFPKVVINEAMTRPQGSGVAWVELQNLSSTPADISGWFLTDDFSAPKKYRVPSPKIIPAGGFLVLNGNDFRSSDALQPFILDPLGEEIYLFSGDAQTNLTGYVHGFKYGVQKTNETFGRYVTGAGAELFVSQQSSTINAANTGPAVPPVVVNEIMYHPVDVFANGAYWNDGDNEYIEIYNRSGATVSLFDAAHPTNSWKISGGANFVFPANASLDADNYALIVSFDPVASPARLAAFQQKYGVGAGVKIFGPYSGNLNNGGETITLSAPDGPLPDGAVPYVTLEEINYDNKAPWPAGADGTDFALTRRDAAKFGNDPNNWAASKPTPAAANSIQLAPVITQQPASQAAPATQNIRLSVMASGQNLRYQWRFNGANILNSTNSALVLTNAQPTQSGAYSVVVFNSTAATASDLAIISVGGDYDRDGIEDNWELDHGLNPFSASDGGLDSDGDGISNLQEYIAGTDPRDANGYLKVEQISASPAETSLTFNAAANRTYTIQYTDSLSPANWQKLTDVSGGVDGATARIADQPTTGTRYYRLVSPAQP
ncbi:MAG TPA: CotH kinase family protein, partial [Verrucomicrobiae bacterium]